MLNFCPLSSHNCDCCDGLWVPRHQASKVHTQLSWPHLLRSSPICVLQATTVRCRNLAVRLQVGTLCTMIQLSLMSGWPQQSTDEATILVYLVPLAAIFAFGVGPCMGIVEPFKLVLVVTAHPQFLALELWAPMGVCPGQYSKWQFYNCQQLSSLFINLIQSVELHEKIL